MQRHSKRGPSPTITARLHGYAVAGFHLQGGGGGGADGVDLCGGFGDGVVMWSA